MNLFESQCITVYHGGTELNGKPSVPFFVSPDIQMAVGYAEERGRDGGAQVFAFDFCPTKVCNHLADDDFYDFLESIGIEPDESETLPYYLDPKVGRTELVNKVLMGLIAQGYDAVLFYDFGFKNDFEELPAYAVLNPATLTNRRVVKP